jgi:hypothetical protein
MSNARMSIAIVRATHLCIPELQVDKRYWLTGKMVPKKLSLFLERQDICENTFQKVRLPYALPSNLLYRC